MIADNTFSVRWILKVSGNATQVVSVRFRLARGLNESLVNGSVAELCLGVGFFRAEGTNVAGNIIADAGVGKAETCRIHNTTYSV